MLCSLVLFFNVFQDSFIIVTEYRLLNIFIILFNNSYFKEKNKINYLFSKINVFIIYITTFKNLKLWDADAKVKVAPEM